MTFSRAIATSSVAISIDAQQELDELSVFIDGQLYAPVLADLERLPGAISPNPLRIHGTTVSGIGGNFTTPASMGSAGIMRLTNNTPTTLTSLTLSEVRGDLGAFFQVCFDDAPVPVPKADVAPVPTLSRSTIAGMALITALLAGWQIRRRSVAQRRG